MTEALWNDRAEPQTQGTDAFYGKQPTSYLTCRLVVDSPTID